MLSAKLLFRAARRLHQAWPRQPPGIPGTADRLLNLLDSRLHVVQHTRQRLAKAMSRGLSLTADHLTHDLYRQVEALGEGVSQVCASLAQPPAPVPSVSDLAAELRQIEAEFGALTIDWKNLILAAVTGPITLEDIYLGPFEIRLSWEEMGRGVEVCLAVVALDPHPAAADERVTHPHVRRRRLCAGEAKESLHKALIQGRLADAFCLVRGVLLHYNSGSPHVALDQWSGSTCEDCGEAVDSDQLAACAACGQECCDSCLSRCPSCQDWFCDGCLEECAVCGAAHSRGCLHRSVSSRRCCALCLKVCAGCGRSFARDELDEQTAHCAACRPATPAPLSPELPTPEELHAPTCEVAGPAAH
ncbi:MAG TPA: hypothetical protein VEL76_34815 [Gemmataceae bacterium]|nr:hypothetical protein [Gemmataceae bacterium]